MRSLLFVALFAPLSSVAVAGTPIINGTADSADPAVVEIYAYPSTKDTLYTCTGIVIAPKAILTAAHCLDHSGYTFGVFYGPDANAYNGQIAMVEPFLKFASSVTIHPDYDRSTPFTADIAVMIMADATDVTPLAFSRTAPTDALVNAAVRIIGYGETTSGTFNNARYAADTIVAGLDSGADTILVGDTHRTCVGDSGGPALQNNVVLGVDSYSAAGCTDPAHYRRTDVYAEFIDSIAGTGSGSGSAGSGSDSGSGSGSGSGSDSGSSSGGGCSTTGGSGAGFAIALIALFRRRQHRAACPARRASHR